ncbi:cell division FtsA domain-containing protein [Clostridium sardiniense]|uniref:cell division FtsA domain-containing protein n=1 Tax=Clostridium sardiniense TaxID=29369 RepID=UPI003D348974
MQEFLVTAIDIGTQKISASCGLSSIGKEVDILGSSCVYSKGVEKGKIADMEKCKEAFLEALDNLEKEIDREIKDIYIGLPSTDVKIQESNFEDDINGIVSPKILNDALKYIRENTFVNDDEEICDAFINCYKVDDKLSLNLAETLEGDKLLINATVVTCKKDVIKKYMDLCIGTRYNIKGFIVNIMSLKKIFFFRDQLGERVMVESGAALTEVAIFKDGVAKELFSIPLGGNNITSDLSICGGLSNEEAEKMKCKYSSNYETLYSEKDEKELTLDGKGIHKELFYKVCEARIEEILNYVNNELKNTGHFDNLCSIILCSDSLTNFENINKLSKEIMNDRVRIFTKNDFGMQNFSNITSLAIVKEVHDRVELICEDFTKDVKDKTLRFEKISDINRNEECDIVEKEDHVKKKKNNKGIRGKLRSLLEDIF